MRGKAVDITNKLNADSAPILAQWIGGANVIRNQKITENDTLYQQWKNDGGEKPKPNQAVSHIANKAGLDFLKDIPAEIRRNAGSCWYQDLNAALKGLRKAPKIKSKKKKRSCYVTKELFVTERLDTEHCLIKIRASSKKKDLNNFILHVRMPFSADDAANSLRISRQGNKFWLSMSYRKEFDVDSEQQIRESFAELTPEEAAELVNGYDIGKVRQVTSSSGAVFHMQDREAEQLNELESRRQRYQRKYARKARANDRKAGTNKRPRTNNEKVLSAKIAKIESKRARIRKSESHRISKQIAEDAPKIAAFEDINLPNLTAAPKAKQCPETGVWLRNGARAKAGLNKALLNLSLGQIRDFSEYKLRERGKLMVKVKAAYSSQECSVCGYTDSKNRPTQALFSCLKCNHTENADDNASKVLKKRGVVLALSKTFAKGAKKAKRIAVRKQPARDTASLGYGGDVRRAQSAQPPAMSQTEGLVA